MRDSALKFLEQFEKGDISSAFQEILQCPSSPYDRLMSESLDLLRSIINYVDGTVRYTNLIIPESTNSFLQFRILQQFPQYVNSIHFLRYERNIINILYEESEKEFRNKVGKLHLPIATILIAQRNEIELDAIAIENAVEQMPINFRDNFRRKVALFQAWIKLKKEYPYIGKFIPSSLPWHAFRYSIDFNPQIVGEGEMDLIFFEPLNIFPNLDLENKKKPIFLFETKATFFHMLQFPEFIEAYKKHKPLLYILELYPNEQLYAQGCFKTQWPSSFQATLFADKMPIREGLDLFGKALMKCLSQNEEELKKETQAANWLYAISKNILFKIRESQLGPTRAIALEAEKNVLCWHDPHKGIPPKDLPQGCTRHGYFEMQLSELAKKRTPRRYHRTDKIRLAHVATQIVGTENHAPTRLIKTLLDYYDPRRFAVSLICTERMVWHPLEYPYIEYTSPGSFERGGDFLDSFQKRGIEVFVCNPYDTYLRNAEFIAAVLNKKKIDAAVFHGADEIMLIAAQMTDVPFRVFFDHGGFPRYKGFDAAITSTEESLEIYKDYFQEHRMTAYPLPYAINVRNTWLPEPPSRKELGLPERGFMMTTISNNLDSRLGTDMCYAIAEILKKCPNAYYAPIGHIENRNKFIKIFSELGVLDRFIILGYKENPGQIARVMNLYLNEFPMGSGLAIFDAMAAGCPVVTMYDENGVQQSRYGGIYFGIGRAIKSGNREDYVNLACRLIDDKQMYAEWSEHALSQYEKRANPRSYASNFEHIIESLLSGLSGSTGDLCNNINE